MLGARAGPCSPLCHWPSSHKKGQTMATTVAHRGRWGYYPCPYELYRKLKRLNLLALHARRRSAAWERWYRKLPHNRKGQEPVLPPISRDDADFIYADYRKARFPVATE